MIRFHHVLLVACSLAACGKKSKSEGGGGGTVDVTAANAAVPASWKTKLEFAPQKLGNHDDFVMVAAPKGWKPGVMKDSLEPLETNKDFGFATKFSAGSTCGGECKSKPAAAWEAAANKSFFDNILAHQPAPKIIKDEKTPGRRLMIAQDQHTDGNMNQTMIVLATWSDDGERFHYCSADLADESKDLAPAFAAACATMIPAD